MRWEDIPDGYTKNYIFTWVNGRKLASVTQNGATTTFTYDGEGNRIRKVSGNTTIDYIVIGGTIYGEIRTENGTTTSLHYLFDENGTRIGFVLNGTEKYYYRFNLQGDVTGIFNASGTLVAEYAYDAWGNPETPTGDTEPGTLNPIRYRGYYYDFETGLYYVSSRYYDPEIGRWINADGVIAGTSDSVHGYNQFAYCFNNPVNMSDSTGNWPDWDKLVQGTLLIGMGLVAVATIVTSGGAATPAVALAYATIATTGTVTVAIGGSEVYESFTGTNPIRDDVGSENYDTLKSAALTICSLGVSSLPVLQQIDTPSLSPSINSKGSTAKTQPKNLTEQLALEQVMSNPQGKKFQGLY